VHLPGRSTPDNNALTITVWRALTGGDDVTEVGSEQHIPYFRSTAAVARKGGSVGVTITNKYKSKY